MDQDRYVRNNPTPSPSNFTIGFRYLILNRWPIRRRTLFLEPFPNKLNLFSSLHKIFDHSVVVQLMCSLVNSKQAALFFFETSDFLHALRETRLFSKRRLTILLLMSLNGSWSDLFYRPNGIIFRIHKIFLLKAFENPFSQLKYRQ